MSMVRRLLEQHPIRTSFVTLGILAVVSVAVFFPRQPHRPIKVGILHSMTGPLAARERPIVNATLLAIEQINAAGGILGRHIEPVIADGESNPAHFAEQAERLLGQDHVRAIFGCYTPAVRRAVRPVVERYHGLLFYPGRDEGFEQSPNIIYVGSSLNQHVTFAVHWAFGHLGHRFYLIGTDALYPHVANALIKKYLPLMGGKVVGEHYLEQGSQNVQPAIADIRRLHPDAVISTVENGENGAFLHALAAAKLGPGDVPLLSLLLSASEAKAAGSDAAGSYVSASYFQSIDTPASRAFVAAFRKMYGEDEVVDSGMEAAYAAVHLWASAVSRSDAVQPDIVLQAVRQKSMVAPEGIISIDYDTNHAWRHARVGRLQAGGRCEVVADSGSALRPQVSPLVLPYSEASRMFARLYRRWNEHWDAPALKGTAGAAQ